MCNPLLIGLATTAVSAYASIQSGKADYVAGQQNAEILRRNAQAVEDEVALTKDAAAIERRRLGDRVQAERGEQIVRATAMGVDPGFGTPADLIGDIENNYRIDRNILGRNEETELKRLDKEKADFLTAADMSARGAKGAMAAGGMNAGGALLSGAASVSSQWIQPSATATSPASPVIGQDVIRGANVNTRPKLRIGAY